MQRLGRIALIVLELSILSALILATRCANYQEVFIAGNVYFTDADCYARMSRVRMCWENPGLIVRHLELENFPDGTSPHTTAPLDYLIVSLSLVLKPFTAQPIDLAGALVSPLLAVVSGIFLWWWSQQMQFRYRWMLLILYSISPILVHGSELGRPDHQSLSVLLVTIAICAEWTLRRSGEVAAAGSYAIRESRIASRQSLWAGMGGISWALALWVSFYEPLIILMLVLLVAIGFRQDRHLVFARNRGMGWMLFVGIIAMAFLIERRIPSLTMCSSNELFKNWSRSIGELAHVSPANAVWLRWSGYLLLVTPILVWVAASKSKSKNGREMPAFLVVLLIAAYCLTLWQARWAYFFVLMFALALPAFLEQIKSRTAVWLAFTLSILPIMRDWDERLWPGEPEMARRIEQRNDAVQLRELATNLRSSATHSFLAPWWLSPSIAYWSGQPGVAGSSHESLPGIEDSARFFMSEDSQISQAILQKREVSWVFAYDAERVAQNSAAILGRPTSGHMLCFVMDRTPSQVPPFLILAGQNGAAKLYRVVNKL